MFLVRRHITYDSAGGQRGALQPTCIRVFTYDTELQVQHATTFMLRSFRWLVTHQFVGEPLLGGPLLKAPKKETQTIIVSEVERKPAQVEFSINISFWVL